MQFGDQLKTLSVGSWHDGRGRFQRWYLSDLLTRRWSPASPPFPQAVGPVSVKAKCGWKWCAPDLRVNSCSLLVWAVCHAATIWIIRAHLRRIRATHPSVYFDCLGGLCLGGGYRRSSVGSVSYTCSGCTHISPWHLSIVLFKITSSVQIF